MGSRPKRVKNFRSGIRGPGLQWSLSHVQTGASDELLNWPHQPILPVRNLKGTCLVMLWGLKEIIPWMLGSSTAKQRISPQEFMKISWSFLNCGLSTVCLLPFLAGDGVWAVCRQQGYTGQSSVKLTLLLFCFVFLPKPKKIWNFYSKNGVTSLWFQRSQRNHI